MHDLQAASLSGTAEGLSDVELREEQLCEQERYLALYHDLEAIKEQEGKLFGGYIEVNLSSYHCKT